MHQGGFLATQRQLQTALASGCLAREYHYHWSYGPIETADTELYFRCGLMKVMPLETGTHLCAPLCEAASPPCCVGPLCIMLCFIADVDTGVTTLAPYLIHHLPDKYVREGTEQHKFHITAQLLLRWLGGCQVNRKG